MTNPHLCSLTSGATLTVDLTFNALISKDVNLILEPPATSYPSPANSILFDLQLDEDGAPLAAPRHKTWLRHLGSDSTSAHKL